MSLSSSSLVLLPTPCPSSAPHTMILPRPAALSAGGCVTCSERPSRAFGQNLDLLHVLRVRLLHAAGDRGDVAAVKVRDAACLVDLRARRGASRHPWNPPIRTPPMGPHPMGPHRNATHPVGPHPTPTGPLWVTSQAPAREPRAARYILLRGGACVRQRRGQCGDRQVEGAKVGLTHCTGGGISGFDHGACSIHMFSV